MNKSIANVEEFIKRTKNSKSTIYRFYKKNEDLFSETIIKSGKRYFPIEHEKYFNSEKMFEENKILTLENNSMKKLIDYCLSDINGLPFKFWTMDWDFFVTVAYKSERNKISCYRQISSMYYHLLEKYGDDTELRLFFTTEPFTNRTGYHNHFVLNISNKELYKAISNEIKSFFQYDRVDLTTYNKYSGGIFYLSKNGMTGEDWDILDTNLKQISSESTT